MSVADEVPQVRRAASIELRRHNAAFCTPDFQEFFHKQVREAIRKHRMFTHGRVDPGGGVRRQGLARAVGRADRRGYPTTGLYLDLGIFDYSVESKAKCEQFAAARGVPLIVATVADEVGAPVPVIKQRRRAGRRAPAAASPSATS